MKGRTTLVLLGVLIALSAYVYFGEYKGKEKKDKAEQLASRVTHWEKEDIGGFELRRSGETFLFEREGDHWRIKEPLRLDADKYALDGFVSAVVTSSIEREIVFEDPASFGLVDPVYTIILEKSGSERDTLFVGDKNATGKLFFIRRAGEDRIMLTGTGLETHLKKTLFDFRDKQVLAFQKADVRDVTLQMRKESLTIEKRESDWFIIHPIEAPADKNAVEALLNKLGSAQAKSFESETADNPGRFGLSKPHATLTLRIGDERAQKQLFLGGAKASDRYFARNSSRPAVFTIDSTTYYGVRKSLFDLRDKRIARFNREAVNHITVKTAGNAPFISHQDTAGNWHIEEPEAVKAKNWKVSSFLSSMESMNATEFIGESIPDRARFGFRKPRVEIFLAAESDTILHLILGAESGEDIYVANRSSAWIYKAEKRYIQSLTPVLSEWAEEALENEEKSDNPE